MDTDNLPGEVQAADDAGNTDSPASAASTDNAGQPDTPQTREPFSAPIFASFAKDTSLPAERLGAVESWLATADEAGTTRIEHGYDIRDWRDSFGEADQPILTSFLNAVSRAGWSQQDVNRALSWYLAQNWEPAAPVDSATMRQLEALDRQDRDSTRGVMRERWGSEYDANRDLVSRHLDNLPSERRAWYEGADQNGRLRLNDPETLDRLAQEARAAVPPALAQAAKEHGSEKAALEAMIRDRTSAYWKGPDAARLQARYRDLLR